MPTPEMKTGTAEGKWLSDCFPGGVLGETLLCVRSVGLTFRVSFALTTEDIISQIAPYLRVIRAPVAQHTPQREIQPGGTREYQNQTNTL